MTSYFNNKFACVFALCFQWEGKALIRHVDYLGLFRNDSIVMHFGKMAM